MPAVTVVVPVRNESRSIEATLRTLCTQDLPDAEYEVIVADGLSTDGTVPTVRRLQSEFPHLHLVYNPARLASAGRNTAARHARGEFLVIVDGHCQVPDRGYLRTLLEAFRTSGADALGRPQPLDAPRPTRFQQAVSVARASRLGHNPDSDIYSDEAKFVPPQSTAVAYRREVFDRVGMFDQRFDACEDVEFNQRVADAGLVCYFEPKLKVVYHPRASWKALFTQLARYGCGRARLAAKTPRSLTPPAVVPPAWGVWLVLGGLLTLTGLAPDWFLLAYFGSIALYAAVILAGSAWLARRHPPAVGVRLPAVFVAIHLGFAWGFAREAGVRAWRRLRAV